MKGDIPAGLPAVIDYLLEVEHGNPVQVTSAQCIVKDNSGASVAGSPFVCTVSPLTAAVEIVLTFSWTPTAGQYRREYRVTYSGGSQETFTAPVLVVSEPVAQDIATYDLATDIGKCRFWANDKDVNDPEWSDPEIQVSLDLYSDPVAAAISLLELRAQEYIRDGLVIKTATRTVDTRQRGNDLLALAKQLRETTLITNPYVDPPTRIFIPAYVDRDPVTTMDPW